MLVGSQVKQCVQFNGFILVSEKETLLVLCDVCGGTVAFQTFHFRISFRALSLLRVFAWIAISISKTDVNCERVQSMHIDTPPHIERALRTAYMGVCV